MSKQLSGNCLPVPGTVAFPMIGFTNRSTASSWGGMLQEITTNKFNKFLEGNQQDGFFYNFLMESTKPIRKKASNIDDPALELDEEQKVGRKLLFEGIKGLVTNIEKRRQTRRKSKVVTRVALEATEGSTQQDRAKETFKKVPLLSKQRAQSFEQSSQCPAPQTYEEMGVIVPKKEEECYLLKNLSIRRLYLLVLKIMVEQFKLSPKQYTRRKSAEDLESGGECKKLTQCNGHDDAAIYRDLLTQYYCMHENEFKSKFGTKGDKAEGEAKSEPLIPWYLDPNPSTLKDSLEGLKQALMKLATEKESIVYRHSAANGNLLIDPKKVESGFLTDGFLSGTPEFRFEAQISPMKLKSPLREKRVGPTRKDSGQFKFFFPQDQRGSNRSINIGGGSQVPRSSTIGIQRGDSQTALGKSLFRNSKHEFALQAYQELEEELLVMDKVREVVLFASKIPAVGYYRNMLGNLSTSDQSQVGADSLRFIADSKEGPRAGRVNEHGRRSLSRQSGALRYTQEPDPIKQPVSGPQVMEFEKNQQPSVPTGIDQHNRKLSDNRSTSMMADGPAVLDRMISRRETLRSQMKFDEPPNDSESKIGNPLSLDDTHVEILGPDRMYKKLMDQFSVKIATKLRNRLQRAVKISKQAEKGISTKPTDPPVSAEFHKDHSLSQDLIAKAVSTIKPTMKSIRCPYTPNPKSNRLLEKALLKSHEKQRLRMRQAYAFEVQKDENEDQQAADQPEETPRLKLSIAFLSKKHSQQDPILAHQRNSSQESFRLSTSNRHMAPISPYLCSGVTSLHKLSLHKRSTTMAGGIGMFAGTSLSQKQQNSSAGKILIRRDESTQNSLEPSPFRIQSHQKAASIVRSQSSGSDSCRANMFKPNSFTAIPHGEYQLSPLVGSKNLLSSHQSPPSAYKSVIKRS